MMVGPMIAMGFLVWREMASKRCWIGVGGAEYNQINSYTELPHDHNYMPMSDDE